MPNITDFTGEHFTIRISRNEFENKGFSVNEFNGDRFLNMLYQSSDELHEFINIRKNDELCLFLDTSEVIETDLILALFATTETLNEEIELLERVEQAMHVASVSVTYCEEINFFDLMYGRSYGRCYIKG